MNNIELLKEMGSIVKAIPHVPNDTFWYKEEELIKRMHERNKKLWDSIQPTWETVNRKFDV